MKEESSHLKTHHEAEKYSMKKEIETLEEEISRLKTHNEAEKYSMKEEIETLREEISGFKTQASECPSNSSEISFSSTFHEAEKYFMQKQIETLKEEVRHFKTHTFGFSHIVDDKMCLYYTGLNIEVFEVIVKLCSRVNFNYYCNKNVLKLSFKDQVFRTVCKLQTNFAYSDLAWRFGISPSTALRIFYTFLPVLHKVVFQSIMHAIPSRKKNETSLPLSFASFTSCRIIGDCTEMRCEVPKHMDYQKLTFSSYKHYNDLKVFLCIAPNGSVTFCSKCYPGSTSDKEIFKHCGVVEQLKSGDMILADKGFLISDCVPQGVTVNIPPFLCTPQFTPSQVLKTRNIAKARIHVKRVNARLKNYKILQFFPRTLFDKASIIVQVCAGLINFQNPLIREMEQDFYAVEDE